MQGTMSAGNYCGLLGKNYTSVTIAITPGGLSSLSYLNSAAPVAEDGVATVSYDPDLPASCQAYQYQSAPVVTETDCGANSQDCSAVVRTVTGSWVGPGKPMLAPPKELLELDPAWRSCIWNTGNARHWQSCKT